MGVDNKHPEGFDARDADLWGRVMALSVWVIVNGENCVAVKDVLWLINAMAIARHNYKIEELESHRDAQ